MENNQIRLGGIKAAAQKAGEQISEVSRQTTTQIANAIVDPDSQKQFVLGQKTQSTVLRPDGSVLLETNKLVTMTDVTIAEQLGILDRLYRSSGQKKQVRNSVPRPPTPSKNSKSKVLSVVQPLA